MERPSVPMRYRRLAYRYALVLAPREAQGRAEWPAARPGTSVSPCFWRPRADVVETSTGYRLTVDLAGVEAEDVDVLVFEDAVVVEGVRKLEPCDASEQYHVAEIPHGPFRLEVRLKPTIDPDRTELRYERGLLSMCLRHGERR